MNKINECTIVAGKNGNDLFLFKNGDNVRLWDHEIIRDIVNGVEVVYYSNQNGWCEGFSELGIGLVYAFFTKDDVSNNEFLLKGKTSLPETDKINPNYLSKKGKHLLKVISSKTIEDALKIIKDGEWDGNYYLSNGKKTLDIEKFEGQFACREITFLHKKDFYVKSNHGQQIPSAGHLDVVNNLRRPDSEIRQSNAERYLIGFDTYEDVIKRMQFQEFDPKSTFNLFRTDDRERTTTQILFDLNNLEYNFIYFDKNSKFYGILNKLPKNYKPKIKINIIDRQKFQTSEFDEFMKMKDNLYTKKGKDYEID